MEPIAVDYEVEPVLYTRAYRAFVWRTEGGWVIGGGLALALAAGFASSEPWLSGLLAGAGLAYLLLLWGNYRRVVAASEARGRARVFLTIADAGLNLRSERGEYSVPWERILGVAVRGDFVELDLGPPGPPVWIRTAAIAGKPLEAIQELRQRRRFSPAPAP